MLQASLGFGALQNFGIVIEATYGGSWRGDIGIDDIKFSNCALKKAVTNCNPGTQFACASGMQCIDNRYLCDGKVRIYNSTEKSVEYRWIYSSIGSLVLSLFHKGFDWYVYLNSVLHSMPVSLVS